ncbi:MAG: MurR/RpiR family transcriptional regulator [Lachnospiraceae bacterium]|nr:MurR/RpiR family transcriptional regulator [Lachnospiraceae bacterium]
MGTNNVIDLLNNCNQDLTKSEKKIASYILSKINEAQYMSITSLAEDCKVAEATITRFCKKLSYNGYNEFKLALAKAAGSGITEISGISDISDSDSISAMGSKLFSLEASAIRHSLELLNEQDVSRAVDYIIQAQHVFCFGQGGSGVTAIEAWARFITAAHNFQYILDSHMQTMAASLCTPEDVILFFSYSGATRDMVDILRPAKNRGAHIILVTHYQKSPATAFADVVLLCGGHEAPLQSGSIASKIGQMFLIDVLYNEYCRRSPKTTAFNNDATMSALVTKLI